MRSNTVVTETEYKSEFEHTKDGPYLALTSELWNVFCEALGENWPRFNDTALFITHS